MNRELPRIVVMVGPTASGKTEIGLRLAEKFSGEIVSADSRQIYKEMKIGTAKPTSAERKIIPHYLVDFLPPDKNFNAALYKKRAVETITDILRRRKTPFLVGGTGLYIASVVDNYLFPTVPPEKSLRKKLEKKTTEQLSTIYEKLDPKGASLIDKNNRRRLIRAIEVCKAAGKPFWGMRKKGRRLFSTLQIGIKLSKEELGKRIVKRTNKMLRLGLEAEVRKLLEEYGSSPLLCTIGYQEWLPYLEKEKSITAKNKEEIKKEIILHTKQFAKRQMTWFKRDKTINWVKNIQEAEKLVKDFLKK